MNAYSKLLLIGVSAVTLVSVACGKKGNSNNDGNGSVGFGCVQMGAQCVAVPAGYIANGTWDGDIGNDQLGAVSIKVTLRSNNNGFGGGFGGGGFGGGYGGGGYYGGNQFNNQVASTTVNVQMRIQGRWINGQAIATGNTQTFVATINSYGQNFTIRGDFVSNRQTQMNVLIQGSVTASGQIYRRGGAGVSGYGSDQAFVVPGYGQGVSYGEGFDYGYSYGY